MLMKVLRIVSKPGAGIVRDQHLPLRLDHLAQAHRARVLAQRRRRLELLPGDDAVDQARNLGWRRESAVSGLPRLDLLAPGKAKPPDDSRLGRQPRNRHTQPLEIAVDCVVLVRNGELVLRAHPVLIRRARLRPPRDLESPRPDRVSVLRAVHPHLAQRHARTVTHPPASVQVGGGDRRERMMGLEPTTFCMATS